MEAVQNVQKEIDKVFNKFSSLDKHAVQTLSDLINQLNRLKQDFDVLSREYHLSS